MKKLKVNYFFFFPHPQENFCKKCYKLKITRQNRERLILIKMLLNVIIKNLYLPNI